jgi:hypothetical protein
VSVRLSVLLVVVGLLVPSSLARADNPKLFAIVGTNDAFVISLRDASGIPVTHLDPGTYDIAVSDRSAEHDFHLAGPGVDKASSVPEPEELLWTVTFTDGKYTYFCDEHPTIMHGSFTVGAFHEPAKLSGTVGPRRTISLRPGTVTEGSFALTVNDRTRTDNFHLTGPGVNRKTAIAFRGSVVWKLTLAPGIYTYRSDAHRQLRGKLKVTAIAEHAGRARS